MTPEWEDDDEYEVVETFTPGQRFSIWDAVGSTLVALGGQMREHADWVREQRDLKEHERREERGRRAIARDLRQIIDHKEES